MSGSPGKLSSKKLNVLCLSYWYDSKISLPEDLLELYSSTTGWVEALSTEGAQVTVLQRFHRHARFERNGVVFQFHADMYGPELHNWQIPWSFHRAIRRVCARMGPKAEATVVHFNGLLFPLHLLALKAMLPRRSPIVVQHHAERPWRGLRRHVQRWGLRAADGFFFAASGLASPWADDGLILDNQPVYQVMEGSTSFRRKDRATARAKTGVTGDPTVLWVGQLISRKDPLTVLRGFESVLQQAPKARLYMIYGNDDLLPEVRARVASSASLARSVTFAGSVPHAEMESYYNSADYFVLGSHYEGSGYALVEALACGVVPVVTDIPSFRVMTDGGKIGACWPPGDAEAFATAFLNVLRQPVEPLSERAVAFFEDQLSFPAIARKAIKAYGAVAARRAAQNS